MIKTIHHLKVRTQGLGHRCRAGLLSLTIIGMAWAVSLQAAQMPAAALQSEERNLLPDRVSQENYNARAYAFMKTNIMEAIQNDTAISEESMQVEVLIEAGTVTLEGKVRTAKEAGRITELAKDSAGMARIENRVEIGLPQ